MSSVHMSPASVDTRQTTWRHLWLAGLGSLSAGTRTAHQAVRAARGCLRNGLEHARDVAGTAVVRVDVAQRRLERRLRTLRVGLGA